MLPTTNFHPGSTVLALPCPDTTSEEVDLDTLADQIARLAAGIHAATYRLLVLIADFDRREGWTSGFRTCAHWLSWRTGINLGAAREKVRVARALEHLPLLSESIRTGELSYAKVRAATRVATPENEREILGFAHAGTAAHVERLVRAWRRLDRAEEQDEEQQRHERRFLALRPENDGMWKLEGRLDPEVGAVLVRALETAGEALFQRAKEESEVDGPTQRRSTTGQCSSTGRRATSGQRFADAVGLIAERALQCGFADDADSPTDGHHRADRYQVVMHVEATDLTDSADPGGGDLEDGVRVSAETSRRLSCDSSRVVMLETPNGQLLDVGRRTRTIPPAIRRALDRRDRGCRFPGCGVRFADAHHVRHWADGGETRLDNLVLLCRTHHRAVHEGGFGVRVVDGQAHFSRPDGHSLPQAPRSGPLMDDVIPLLPRSDSGTRNHLGASTLWDGALLDLELALDGLRGV